MRILFTDNFTRGAEAPLGGSWIHLTTGVFNLSSSNDVVPANTGSDTNAVYTGITWPNNQFAEAKVTINNAGGGGVGGGVVVRGSLSAGTNTCYRCVIDHAGANNCEVSRFVAGAFTSLKQFTAGPFADGDRLGLSVITVGSAAELRVYRNGVHIGPEILDIGPIGAGAPGLSYSSIAASLNLDNFVGGDMEETRISQGSLATLLRRGQA